MQARDEWLRVVPWRRSGGGGERGVYMQERLRGRQNLLKVA